MKQEKTINRVGGDILAVAVFIAGIFTVLDLMVKNEAGLLAIAFISGISTLVLIAAVVFYLRLRGTPNGRTE